jgi:hypothetical protein
MNTGLDSLSPLSFQCLKIGDILLLKKQIPRKNEYRQSLGAPVESVLVFKGAMKVGMLPMKFLDQYKLVLIHKRVCKVSEISVEKRKIIVEIL